MTRIAEVTSSVRGKIKATLTVIGVSAVIVSTSLAFGEDRHRIPAEELRRLLLTHAPALVLVDVRPPADFAQGHIQHARNIPAGIELAGLPKDGKVVVYCGEDPCALTTGAAGRLMANGYGDVAILEGGIGNWVAKGYPLEKGGIEKAGARVAMVAAGEARKRMAEGGVVPVDVRPADEFAAGHLPGALSIPLETLGEQVARLPKDKALIVYDRLGPRERQAAEKLSEAGFQASELSGGIAGWMKRKLPLEVK